MDEAVSSPTKHSGRITVLATKLLIPRTRRSLVARPCLAERLNACLDRKLTLVSAPAGFGKTTLVSAWAQDVKLPVAWLSLDDADNDPTRFLAYLAATLQRIDPAIGADLPGALETSQPALVEAVIGALANDLVARPADFVLVLDDFHVIHESSIHEAIQSLVAHQPPQMHLVIATREDPPLPLARLRARGELLELRAQDLRFAPPTFLAWLLGEGHHQLLRRVPPVVDRLLRLLRRHRWPPPHPTRERVTDPESATPRHT